MKLKLTIIFLSLFLSMTVFAETEYPPYYPANHVDKRVHRINNSSHVIYTKKCYIYKHRRFNNHHSIYNHPRSVYKSHPKYKHLPPAYTCSRPVYRPLHPVRKPIRPIYHAHRPIPIAPIHRAPIPIVYPDIPIYVPCRTVLSDGFYLGAAGGYDFYDVRQNLNFADLAGTQSANPVFRTNGFLGELFLGYGHAFRTIYLGGEFFGNLTSAQGGYRSNNSNAVFYNNKTTVKGSYGASFLPGFRPTDTSLIYGRIGWTETKFKVNETVTDLNTLTTSNANHTQWKNGFTYGGGIETALVNHVSMRVEYTHTNYGTVNNNVLANNAAGTPDQYTFADNQVMLGLIYHIC